MAEAVQNVSVSLWPGRFIFGEERWADVCGHRMRYLCGGSGPPLLLVHGLMGYSFSWRRNLKELADHYTVYAMDLPGIGFSERPPRGGYEFDLKSIAERLLVWMDSEGMRGADVIGTSHGGGIAMFMADIDQQKATGLVDKLVLVASINPWSKVGRRRTRFFAHRFGAMCMRAFQPSLGLLREWGLRRMYADPRKITEETRAGYDAPLVIRGTVDYLLGIVQYWHEDLAKVEAAMQRISEKRILLLWGAQDRAVPVQSAYEMHKRLPCSDLVVFEGVGHLPYEESPLEFNTTVLQFLGR